MKKTVKKKVYDTETMTFLDKLTVGEYGDPNGYEEVLFVADDGTLFLYTNGGEQSKYTGEKLTVLTAKKAADWKANK